MPINETLVTGKKYRVWDVVTSKWKRISYWTKASDVEFDDGATAEAKISDINDSISQLNSSLTEKTTINEETDTVFAKAPTYDGRVLLNKMYGMSTQNGTPTPSNPVAIKNAKANFKERGKNLLLYPFSDGASKTANNVTFTSNSDGSITVNTNGSASAQTEYNIRSSGSRFMLKKGIEYTLSISPYDTNVSAKVILYNGSSYTGNAFSTGVGEGVRKFTLPTDVTFDRIVVELRVNNGATVSAKTFKTMLSLSEDTTYAEYEGQEVTTDLVLRAIEVTSSDAYNLVKDGKYYVTDTLEKIDGEYQITRRIEVLEYSNQAVGPSSLNDTANSKCYRIDFTGHNTYDPQGIYDYICSNRFHGDRTINGLRTLGGLLCANQSNAIYVYISLPTNVSSSEDAKTWITNNPTEFYTILQNPTAESVSNADAQKLLSLKTYDQATYIAQTEDVEGTMVLKYGSSDFATTVLSAYVEQDEVSKELDEEIENRGILGAKNFWDIDATPSLTNVTLTNGLMTNTNTDSKTQLFATLEVMYKGASSRTSIVHNISQSSTGVKEFDVTFTNDVINVLFKHNGSTRDIGFNSTQNIPKGNYKFSFNLISNNPSTVGGLQISDFMLRLASDTDSTYQPYAMTNAALTEKLKNYDYSSVRNDSITNSKTNQNLCSLPITEGRGLYLVHAEINFNNAKPDNMHIYVYNGNDQIQTNVVDFYGNAPTHITLPVSIVTTISPYLLLKGNWQSDVTGCSAALQCKRIISYE